MFRSDEGPTLETLALELFTVANLHYQLSWQNQVICFSFRERAVLYKSCDLIASESEQFSPTRPALNGRYPFRV